MLYSELVIRTFAFLLALGSLSSARAQTAPAPVHATYVDRGVPLEVERTGRHERAANGHSIELVTIHRAGRRYGAGIDGHAIVELGSASEAQLATFGLRVARRLMPGMFLVESDARDGLAIAADLAPRVRDGSLRSATPDLYLARTRATISVPPNDPRYPGQWYFERIGLEGAWAITTGSPDVTTVVVDDGCELTHPDLEAHLDPGLDVLDEDDDPSAHPEDGAGANHGTACAGLVSAVSDNDEGIAGACPECRLRCVRLLGGTGLVPTSADVNAFEFAIETGAAVVSNSWGFEERVAVPGPLATAIERAFDEGRGGLGALVVFAAGNDNRELGDEELNAVRGVVTVGAINNFDETTPFSNRGPSLDLVSPTGTISTDLTGADGEDPGDYTSRFGGTSSSCPVVAGVAALLFSAKPEATAAEVHDALVGTTRPAPFASPDENGHDAAYGYGIVDPEGALRALLGLPDMEDAGVTEDAGSGDASVDAAAPDAGSHGGGGCAVSGERSSASFFALAALALLGITRRRRVGLRDRA